MVVVASAAVSVGAVVGVAVMVMADAAAKALTKSVSGAVCTFRNCAAQRDC